MHSIFFNYIIIIIIFIVTQTVCITNTFNTLRRVLTDLTIVNRGNWLRSPANITGANKDAKIYVGRSTTVHNLCAHVIKTFWLDNSLVNSKQLLCFVQGQGQKREQKYTTKNFTEFQNHFPLLTRFNNITHIVFNNLFMIKTLFLFWLPLKFNKISFNFKILTCKVESKIYKLRILNSSECVAYS